jgi:hypothetical protein
MKLTVAVLIAGLLGMVAVWPATAADPMECAHDSSVASLRECVIHAAEQGFIDNSGVANSLLAKLDAAQASSGRGQDAVAVDQLGAFVHELDAQAGKHVDAEHATMLRIHAATVIAALIA